MNAKVTGAIKLLRATAVRASIVTVASLIYAALAMIAVIIGFVIFIFVDGIFYQNILQNEMPRSYNPMLIIVVYLLCGPVVLASYVFIVTIYDTVNIKFLLWLSFFLISCISFSYNTVFDTLLYSLFIGALFSLLQLPMAFVSMKVAYTVFKR